MQNQEKVRVRFAPSPTGPLHIGGVRTALFNYLFAKKNNGTFILRIEDTDQNRFVEGAEEYIKEAFAWCGIQFDEGDGIGGEYAPYKQSQRKNIYRQYADKLIENGYGYYAFDTEEELNEMRENLKKAGNNSPQYNSITRETMKNSLTLPEEEVKERIKNNIPYVIRLKVPRNEEIKINDLIRGNIVVHSSKIDDKVLFKSDGMPTYHLANVVDDYLMKISHVIRGEEWLPSMPLHYLLYKYLGWESEMPKFAHLPLILKPSGQGKLSKRDGDQMGFPVFPINWHDKTTNETASGYRENGYFHEAFINILVLLGWNSGTKQEIMNIEELIENFAIEKIGKSGSRFDPEKAKWFNHQYLMQKSNKKLAELLIPLLKERNIDYQNKDLEQICSIMKERANFVKDILNEGIYLFQKPIYQQEQVNKVKKDNSKDILLQIREILQDEKEWIAELLDVKIKTYIKENNYLMGEVMKLVRMSITANITGPSLVEIIKIIGKDEIINRIDNFIEKYL